MSLRLFPALCCSLFSLTCSPVIAQEAELTPEQAQAEQEAFMNQFSWVTSGTGEISSFAKIEIPEGFRFLNGKETADVMEAFGNLPSKYDGMIGIDNLDWFVLFQFEDAGYVDDSEKDDLDADALLESIQEGEVASNEERQERGLDTLNTVGFAVKPKYNESTNNLEWGLILEDSQGQQNVNYLTKVLGRRGIMHTTLVCDPDVLDSVLPQYQNLLTGFEYNSGQKYAEFQEGDKVAEYGLKALIAGGALYGAAKLGLFAFLKKGIKFIVIGVVGIWVFIKRVVTGKKTEA